MSRIIQISLVDAADLSRFLFVHTVEYLTLKSHTDDLITYS